MLSTNQIYCIGQLLFRAQICSFVPIFEVENEVFQRIHELLVNPTGEISIRKEIEH